MYCSNCGKDIGDNSKYCNGCGTEISAQQSDLKVMENTSAESAQLQSLLQRQKVAKKRRKGFAIIFGVLLFLAVLIPIVAYNLDPSVGSGGVSSTSEAQQKEKLITFDTRTWDDFAQMYRSHNILMKAADLYADGKIDTVTLYDKGEEIEEYFRNKAISFNYGTSEDERTYLDCFATMAYADQMAAKGLKKYLDSLKPSDLSDSQKYVQQAKEAAIMIIQNRKILLAKAGLTENEIREKIENDMDVIEVEQQGVKPTQPPTTTTKKITTTSQKTTTTQKITETQNKEYDEFEIELAEKEAINRILENNTIDFSKVQIITGYNQGNTNDLDGYQ